VEASQFLWWRALDVRERGGCGDYDTIKGVIVQFDKEFVHD
jgi:hypothetical protein